MATNIALRIAGTKERKAGFAPLVSIGVLAGNEGENMDKVPLVSEKPAYVLKHASDYILYGLIDRRVKSFDADAPGVLSIALTIAKGNALAGGKSPYSLLMEVYEKFVSTYMTRMSDGRDEFVNVDADDEVFREILNNYPVEPSNSIYIPMSAQGITGLLRVEPGKMEEFFKDTQYREFAQFKDIEIGASCNTTEELGSIRIPRAVEYSVLVNDKPYKTISNGNDLVFAEAEGTSAYEYVPTSFTLQEVLDAPNGRLSKDGAEIVLDTVKERILCKLKKEEVKYKVEIAWDCSEEVQQNIINLISTGQVKVDVNGCDESTQTIPYSCINNQPTITPTKASGYILGVRSTALKSEKVLRLTIKATKERVAVPSSVGTGKNKPKAIDPSNSKEQESGRGGFDSFDNEGSEGEKKSKKPLIMLIAGLVAGLILGVGGTLACQHFFAEEEKTIDDSDSIHQPLLEEPDNDSLNAENIQIVEDSPTDEELTAEELAKAEAEKAEAEAKKAAEEAERQRKAELEAARKAEEELKKAERQQAANNARAEILKMVNAKRSITDIRKASSWKLLSQQEQYVVEAILNLDQYKGTEKKKVKDVLQGHSSFSSWEDMETVRQQIIKALSE